MVKSSGVRGEWMCSGVESCCNCCCCVTTSLGMCVCVRVCECLCARVFERVLGMSVYVCICLSVKVCVHMLDTVCQSVHAGKVAWICCWYCVWCVYVCKHHNSLYVWVWKKRSLPSYQVCCVCVMAALLIDWLMLFL